VNTRQSKLLAAIIDQFIATAMPVGSKRLLEVMDLPVSPATIRMEMASLEDQGFLQQPHVSAGRVPTADGYRMYVREFMEPTRGERVVRRKFEELRQQYMQRKDRERAFEAVLLLSKMIPNVCFATIPHRPRVYYMGLSNVLRQPEFQADSELASGIVEVLEERLANLLDLVPVDDKIRYYIGEEDIFPRFPSCALIVTEYRVRDYRGAIGVLGHMRMDYAYNTVALDLVADLLRMG
jgi:transcriptional regulator of heat shock response